MAWHFGPPYAEPLGYHHPQLTPEHVRDNWTQVMGQVGGDLESNMSVRTLDSLTVSIDTTAVLYVSLGLLAVMLVCVAISCIPMLRKSPRSLSELR